jgi:hypothetical protein
MMLAAKYGIDVHGPLPEDPEDVGREANSTGDLKSLNHRWIQAFNDRDWQTESAVRSESFRAYLSGIPEPLDNAAWSGFMIAFTAGSRTHGSRLKPASQRGIRWLPAGRLPALTKECSKGFRLQGVR